MARAHTRTHARTYRTLVGILKESYFFLEQGANLYKVDAMHKSSSRIGTNVYSLQFISVVSSLTKRVSLRSAGYDTTDEFVNALNTKLVSRRNFPSS
jgi:hypothetical protein